jgi:tetratricopeptide (TPR) repeat protein
MDAEHRHELKTNELAAWMMHFPDFCRRNASTLIGVVLIVAAAAVYVYGKKIRSQGRLEKQAESVSLVEQYDISKLQVITKQQQNMQTADDIMIAANRLEMAVDKAVSREVSALLLIKQGEALRADLHYRPEEVDVGIMENRINEARQAYEKALPLAEGNPTLLAMARFGLGLCAEELGDYIRAEEIYNGIIADASFAATVFPAQARGRLDNMQDNRMQFEFVAAPAPDPAAATPPVLITPAASDKVEEAPVGADNAPQPRTPPGDSPAVENPPQAGPAAEEAPGTSGQPDESPDMNP